MKKNFFIIVLLYAAMILTFSSCDKGAKVVSFSDDNFSDVENYYGVITEYTSGFITNNTPIYVRLNSDMKLKKNMGEDLSKDIFSITPKIPGAAYWVDDHTIGYKFDKNADEGVVYNVNFNLSELVDLTETTKNFRFAFAIRPLNFSIFKTAYHTTDATSCSYRIDISFSNHINPDEALKLMNDDFRNKYNVSARQLPGNKVQININDIARSNNEGEITVEFNGNNIGVDKKLSLPLTIPAANEFKVVSHHLDVDEKKLEVYYSNVLKQNQSLDGPIVFNPSVPFKSAVSGNVLTVYFEDADGNTTFDGQINYVVDADGSMQNVPLDLNDMKIAKILPKVEWIEDGTIIPDIENPTVYFKAMALKSVTIRLVKIYNSNVLNYLRSYDIDNTWGVRQAGRMIKKVKIQLNTQDYEHWNTFAINLSDYVEMQPGDMYQVIVDFDMSDFYNPCDEIKRTKVNDEEYWNGQEGNYKVYSYEGDWWISDDPCLVSYYNDVEIKKNFMFSNVAVTVKSALEGSLTAFVRNVNTAEPIVNADVVAYNYQLQEVAAGKTDKNGVCELSCDGAYFIVAHDEKQGEAYIKLERNLAQSMSKFDISGTSVTDNINGFIYSNRDVWRPGDSLDINFILSDRENKLPQNFPVVFELYDANNHLYVRKTGNNPTGNIYSFNTATRADDVTGTWTAYIKVGNSMFTKSLRVETIKPNRLDIKFDVPEMVYLHDNMPVRLHSQWLNGLTASGLKATIDVNMYPTETSFKNYAGYKFTDCTSEKNASSFTLFSNALDAEGSRNISMAPLADVGSSTFMNAYFTIKVFEQGGDFSISSRHAVVSPAQYYVGVAMPEPTSVWGEYYATNKDWQFPMVIVNEKGTALTDGKINCKLYKLEDYWWWSMNGNLSTYVNNSYYKPFYENVVYVNGGTANLQLNIKDADWGAYLLIATDMASDARFAQVVYFDSDYSAHSSGLGENAATIKLSSTKDTYEVGEDITVTFPANAKSKAIVTVESGSGVLQTIRVDKLEDNAKITFKATDKMTPNIYVYVSLIQPYNSGNDLPIRMYGVLPLTITSKNAKITPVITMPAESNSNKEIEIKVSESNGKKMYYTLALVDEGILGLTNYKTANPFGYFFSKQALSVRTWDNYADMVDAFTGEMMSVFAIGGDMSVNNIESVLSKRFSAVAYSFGPFELPAGTTQSHKVKIPEYIGSLRAMVVASNDENAYGSADKTIKIINPLMLVPSVPRIVAPNDKFIVPVQVLSPENPNKTITLNVAADNLTSGNSQVSVTTNKNGEGMAYPEFNVPSVSGNAEITLTSSINGYNATSKTTIPIRLPLSVKRDKLTMEIAPGQSHTFNMPIESIKGTAKGNVIANSVIPVDIFSLVDYIERYPYGSLESIVSAAFPQLYIGSLTSLNEQQTEKVKVAVEKTIGQINAFLKDDYSLSNWKSGEYVNYWNEIYALHFLTEAKKCGFAVDESLLKGLTSYQASRAKSWAHNPDYAEGDVIEAYRLFVLSLNNAAETGAMNKLMKVDSLNVPSRSLLASSYAMVGKMNKAKELIPGVDFTQNVYDNGNNLRDVALVAYSNILCESDDQLIRKHIDFMGQVLTSDAWINPQAVSMSLFVLSQYAKAKGFDNAPIDVTVDVNGTKKQLTTNLSSVSEDFVPGSENSITVTNNSKSSVYATVSCIYSAPEYEFAETGNGYKMSVKYRTTDGNTLDVASLNRNQDFIAEISVQNNTGNYSLTDNALTFMVPSGWEIVNGFDDGDYGCNHVDRRDDRVYFFFDLYGETKTFRVKLNATYQGTFTLPAITIENMLNNDYHYTIPAKKVVVR